MFWTMYNHHLWRIAASQPVMFTSSQLNLINIVKYSKTQSSMCHFYSGSSLFTPKCYNASKIKAHRSDNFFLNSSCVHRKYSLLHNNDRTNIFKFSSGISSGYSSQLLTSQKRQIHCQDHRTKLCLPSQYNGNMKVVSVREGHHLSQNQQSPQLLTDKSQGSPSNLGNVQPSRAINIPKAIFDTSPASWQPYLQLIRFDKPIGTWLLYWPCTWSIALAAQPGCWPDFYMLALFGAGAFFMRGAGCIINDMWDKDFDIKVERTKERPLACDKVSYPQALAFLATQLGISLAILLQLNWYSIGLGVASMSLVITYPTFKRFTYWPQIVLGFAFNYGALLGWAAVRGSCDWSICIPMYLMCHMWTMIYDTVYAHQDKSDDILIGVKSTALRLGDQTKPWLSGFTAVMASGLLYVGHITNMTWPYYSGASIAVASILTQLYRLDIDNPDVCGDAFRFHFYIGLLMFVSIMFGNLAKPRKEEEEMKELSFDAQS